MLPVAQYVLVVDDFADGREMLVEYLTFRGLDVVEAAGGEAALTIARQRPPAVILMDLQMPGLDGWKATRALKADPATKDVVIIALTAHALLPDEAIARRAGCDGFIAKPYDITAVGDAVAELIRDAPSGLAAVDALRPVVSRPSKRHELTGN